MDADDYDRSPFMAELYDCIPAVATRPDIAFYVEAARERGGPVLELGCGTGRILIPTARARIDVRGLDGSRRMLAACQTHVEREPPDVQARIRLHQGDIRAFDLGQAFRLITLPFRVFQYLLTVDEQLACLAAVRDHLEQAGRVILDLAEPSIPSLATPVDSAAIDEEPFTHPDGRTIVRRHRNLERDLITQTFSNELGFLVAYPDGRTERHAHRHRFRYVFRFEAEHLLARAGFTIESVFSGFDRAPYGAHYPGELIFVARR